MSDPIDIDELESARRVVQDAGRGACFYELQMQYGDSCRVSWRIVEERDLHILREWRAATLDEVVEAALLDLDGESARQRAEHVAAICNGLAEGVRRECEADARRWADRHDSGKAKGAEIYSRNPPGTKQQ